MPTGIYKRTPEMYGPERAARISASLRGNKNCLGRKMSDEQKRKIAIALTGNQNSAGVVRTPEYCAALGERMRGPKNPHWKGDDVSYHELHKWLNRWKKKPRLCVFCGKEKKLDWANIDGLYRRAMEDYIALCRSCHVKYDRR
jgi:hypothetical protein